MGSDLPLKAEARSLWEKSGSLEQMAGMKGTPRTYPWKHTPRTYPLESSRSYPSKIAGRALQVSEEDARANEVPKQLMAPQIRKTSVLSLPGGGFPREKKKAKTSQIEESKSTLLI